MTATSTPASDLFTFLPPAAAPLPAAGGGGIATADAPEFAALLAECAQPPADSDFYAALSAESQWPTQAEVATDSPTSPPPAAGDDGSNSASEAVSNDAATTEDANTQTEIRSADADARTDTPAPPARASNVRSARGSKSTARSPLTNPAAQIRSVAGTALTDPPFPESRESDPTDPTELSDPDCTAIEPASPPLPTDDDAAAAALTAAILSAQFHLLSTAPAAPATLAPTPAPAAIPIATTPGDAPLTNTSEKELPSQRAAIAPPHTPPTAPNFSPLTPPTENTSAPSAKTTASDTPINTQFRAPAAALHTLSPRVTAAHPTAATAPSVSLPFAPTPGSETTTAFTPIPLPLPLAPAPVVSASEIALPIQRAEIATALALPEAALPEHAATSPAPDTSIATQFRAPAAAVAPISPPATTPILTADTKPSVAVPLAPTSATEATPASTSIQQPTAPVPAPPSRATESILPIQRAEIATAPTAHAPQLPAAPSAEHAATPPAPAAAITPQVHAPAATTPIPAADTKPFVAVPFAPTSATDTARAPTSTQPPITPAPTPTPRASANELPIQRAESATTPQSATPPGARALERSTAPSAEHAATPPASDAAITTQLRAPVAAVTPFTPAATTPIPASDTKASVAVPTATTTVIEPTPAPASFQQPTAPVRTRPSRGAEKNPPIQRAEIALPTQSAVEPKKGASAPAVENLVAQRPNPLASITPVAKTFPPTIATNAPPLTPTATVPAGIPAPLLPNQSPTLTPTLTPAPALRPAPAAGATPSAAPRATSKPSAIGEVLPRQTARPPASAPAPAALPARQTPLAFHASAVAPSARPAFSALPLPQLPLLNPRWLQIITATATFAPLSAPNAAPSTPRAESSPAQNIFSARPDDNAALPTASLGPTPSVAGPPRAATPLPAFSLHATPLAPLPFATHDSELIAVEWVDLHSAEPNEASAGIPTAEDNAAPASPLANLPEISPASPGPLRVRPARNDSSNSVGLPAPARPCTPATPAARAASSRPDAAAEQRVVLEFRDPAGALFRVISQPETWLALGSTLLPGWRHAHLADADRQEIPTLPALSGSAGRAENPARENPAGSENREPGQFSSESRDDLSAVLANPTNAHGLETADRPAFTAVNPAATATGPAADAANPRPKNENGEKSTDATAAQACLGTTTAPKHSNMNTADAGNPTAPRTEKSLPLVMGFAGTADSPVLPGQWKIRRESRPFATTALATDPSLAPWAARATSDPRDLELAAAPLLPESVRVPMERVQTLISREVTLVRQLGADALAIVLKPDSRTELFLQISHHDGKTEALIRCERGDFEHLQKNWGQLQSSLAGQQVTLGPLQRPTLASQEITDRGAPSSNASFSANTGTGQHPQRQPEQAPRSLDELPLVGSLTEPFKRRATHRATPASARGTGTVSTNKTGLERWA